jgi:hypothetical protein
MKLFKITSNKSKEPSCRSCLYYGCVKSDDRLNPDKTVTKGKIEYEFCHKGKFYLTEYKSCELYKEGKSSRVRIMPPPIPKGEARK